MEPKFIPLNEWLIAKAKERIAQALENSNNRNAPEYVVVRYTKTPPKNLNGEELKLYEKYKTHQGWPVFGWNCINTVTTDYGNPVSGNCTFRENAARYGFEQVDDKSTLPGDLVQFWPNGSNKPTHAMMAVTPYIEDPKAMRYNGVGGYPTGTKVLKNSPVKMGDNWEEMTTFRYVGTPRERDNWTNEWRDKYTHKPLLPTLPPPSKLEVRLSPVLPPKRGFIPELLDKLPEKTILPGKPLLVEDDMDISSLKLK